MPTTSKRLKHCLRSCAAQRCRWRRTNSPNCVPVLPSKALTQRTTLLPGCSHWAEQLQQGALISVRKLCALVSASRVLDGLFGLERLFGIRIEAADGEAPVWHEDVRFFRVLDRDHAPLAAFYSTRSAVLPASVAAPG